MSRSSVQVLQVRRKSPEVEHSITNLLTRCLEIYFGRAIVLTTPKDFGYQDYSESVTVSLHMSKWSRNAPESIRMGFDRSEEKQHFNSCESMELYLRNGKVERWPGIDGLRPVQQCELRRCLELCQTKFLPKAFNVLMEESKQRSQDPIVELMLEFRKGFYFRRIIQEAVYNPDWVTLQARSSS